MMKNLFNFLAIFLFPLLLAAQEKISANLFDLKSNQEKKLFTLDIDVIPQGDQSLVQSVFRDLQGTTVVKESSLIKGDELVKYEITREQTSEKGLISVREGRVYFEYEGPGGKKKEADEKLKGAILCSGNFSGFVNSHWDKLVKGEAIDIRFAVWDRLETVGFTLKKMKDFERDGQKILEVQMKPTSFVIAALVEPLYFWYSYNDHKLQVLKGRVPPKIQVGGSWKDLDAEVVYTYDQKVISK